MQRNHGPWWALGALCLGMALLYMNTTMVTQSLPALSSSLSASPQDLEWVVSAYNLAFLAVLLPGGALGDRYGHRRVLLGGIAIFGIGAAVSTAVANPAGLILTRAAMGVGASVFTPMSLALLPRLFPPRSRPLATSLWSISGALGAPFGPLAGGVLIDRVGWRGIFVLDLVVSLVVFVACARLIPPAASRTGTEPLPLAQAITSATAFGLITWGLVSAAASWSRPQTLAPLFIGLVLLAAFIRQASVRRPSLADLRLFTRPAYANAAICLGAMNLMLFGMLYFLPDYFQTVLDHHATTAGLLLMPLVLMSIIGSAVVARLARIDDLRGLLLPATMTLIAVGCGISAFTRPTGPTLTILGLMLVGGGIGAGQSFALVSAMVVVPPDRQAAGAALINAVRQFGALVGTALVGSAVTGLDLAFARRQAGHLADSGAARALTTSLQAAHRYAAAHPATGSAPLESLANVAYTRAVGTVFAACAIIAGGIAIILLISHRRPDHDHT